MAAFVVVDEVRRRREDEDEDEESEIYEPSTWIKGDLAG